MSPGGKKGLLKKGGSSSFRSDPAGDKLKTVDKQSSFREVETALKEALDIVNAEISSAPSFPPAVSPGTLVVPDTKTPEQAVIDSDEASETKVVETPLEPHASVEENEPVVDLDPISDIEPNLKSHVDSLPSVEAPAVSHPDQIPDVIAPPVESYEVSGDATTHHIGSILVGELEPEIEVMSPAVSHDIATEEDHLSSQHAEDKWLHSSKSMSNEMMANIADSTTVYHIGTPTLFPSSANPSFTLSSADPVILSPLLDESSRLGRMVAVKPSPGTKAASAHVLKMIVLGDASVGKTALIQRFVNGHFDALPYKPTVGADFYSQKLEFTLPDSGETISLTLQIWDTAGQERYKSLASSFYRGADICVIVEDCTRSDCLKTVAQWHEDFLRHAAPFEPESFPFLFLLNKSDLLGDAEAVALEKLWRKLVAERFQVPASRAGTVSAKSGENVEESLFFAAKIAAQRTMKTLNQVRAQGNVINLNNRVDADESIFSNCLC